MIVLNRNSGFYQKLLSYFTAILCALFLFSSPAAAQTAYTYINTVDAAFNETSFPCTSPLLRTFNVTDSFLVSDLDVGLLIGHTRRGHIRATLQAPAASGGAIVTLIDGIGGGRDHLNILFNDSNANPITNHTGNDDVAAAGTVAPPWEENTYRPQSPLTAFNGIQANGTWTLRICDTSAGDNGNFYQANLNFTSPLTSFVDLSVAKTILSNIAPTSSATGTITYRLTVNNASSATLAATGVIVTDTIPTPLRYVSDTGGGTFNATTGAWTVGSLAIGETKTVDVTFLVLAQTGTITNVAQVTAQGQVDLDSTPGNGVTTEDDYSTVGFTATARSAGTPPTISCPVGSTLFNWGDNIWGTGSLNNTYNLVGVGNFNIAMTSMTPYVTGSPAITTQLTGGVAGEVSLFQNLNNNTTADTATTVIAMPGGLPGMQFRLFDIDHGTNSYSDLITVTGSYQGNAVIPVLTNNTSNYVVGNTAIGDLSAADATAAGNVVVTFNAPIDTVTIVYGNHTTAPANPGNQWIGLGDLTFCNPYTSFAVSKVSQVISDGVSATNPKAISGATIQYCLTFNNTGTGTITSVSATDNLTANLTFVPGTMRSGATCGTASTVEDDNSIGADETDPYGMNISGTTITVTATTLAPNSSMALIFNATVN